MMKLQQVTVLVSLLVAVPLHIHGQCSSRTQFVQQYRACLSQFNTLTNFLKGPISGSQLSVYCCSSARTSEIQCAENIFNACKNSDATIRRVLEKTVNVNAIKDSVKILCNNTQIFIDQQDCIGQYQTTVTTCITNEYWSYNTKLQSLETQACSIGAEWFDDKTYAELCDYVGEISDCQRPYGRNCGREVGDVFDALIHAVTPAVCAGVTKHVNLILLIGLAFVTLVKGKW